MATTVATPGDLTKLEKRLTDKIEALESKLAALDGGQP